MNWLMYISGFFLGTFLFGRIFKDYENTQTGIIVLCWLCVWIWICLKFIR